MTIVSDYLALIPAEHSAAARFIEVVTVHAQATVDALALLEELPGLFDLDTAVGQQLDFTGQWIGLTRYLTVPLPDVFFSFDEEGLGWDQGYWWEPFQPTTGMVRLEDAAYRLLLKARVVANQWDGTIPGAYDAWNTLFEPEGYQILIQDGLPEDLNYFTWDGNESDGWDGGAWYQAPPVQQYVNGNMQMLMVLIAPAGTVSIDVVTLALFEGGYLGLKPAAVQIEYYVTQSVFNAPIFAFDVEDGPNLGGWDAGGWGLLTPGS